MPKLLTRRIETAEKRLDALRQMVQDEPASGPALQQVVEDLSVLLEELYAAREELAVQQADLLATQQDLEAERLRYQELFDFAPDAYIVTDQAAIIEEVNRAAEDLLGVSGDLLVDKPLVLFVRPDDRKAFSTLLASFEGNRSLQGQEWELSFESHGRPPVPAALTVSRVHDLEGAMIGLRWLVRDITATKRAEERERLMVQIAEDRLAIEELVEDLERERKMLRTIMENTHAQLAYLDRDFDFVLVNSAYARGAGRSKEDLIGRNHFALFPNVENEAIFEGVRDFGVPVQYRARPFEYADRPELGTTYWDWTLVPVRDTQGEVRGLVLSLLDVTDRVRAAQERERLMSLLDAERARLKAIIDNAPDAIVVTDPSSRIVLANPTAQRLYGGVVPLGEQFESHAALYLCHPDGTPYEPGDLPLSRAAIDGEIHTNLEMALCQPGGELRDLLVSTAPIRDSEGRIDGVVSVFQDITERKRIEEAVRGYAARLQVLHSVDHSILAAESVDAVADTVLAHIRRQVACVRASVALFDLESNRVSLLAVVADGDTRLAMGWQGPLGCDWPLARMQRGETCVWEDLLAADTETPFYQMLREEGVRAYVQLPLSARGMLIGSLDLGMAEPGAPTAEELDIAHEIAFELAITIEQARLLEQVQRHAEELEKIVARRTAALHSSEARLRTIFEGAALGIALSDMEGRILESNQALQMMLGYRAEELVGRAFPEFTHPEDVDADLELFRELMTGERDEYSLDKRYVRKDGAVIWGNLTASLVRGGGQALYAVHMIEDVTQRKQFQEALLDAERLAIAGRMGASLAHEINNPLQSVIGCLGLAEKNLPEGGDASRYLGVARQELRRAAHIVTQLRDMSRLSEEEKREAVDLNVLVEEVLLLSRKQAQEHKVELIWEPAEALPVIQAAPDRLRQVFLNLALNAFDAMAQGGDLRVYTVDSGSPAGARVVFADTGVGMNSDTLSQLFDPFYTTKSQGLGLGLYISRNIVEEHGGRIDVTSRLGEGTTFTVWLPA
jgi:PAS domain S-box-containing protein